MYHISRVTPQMCQYCIIARMILLRWISVVIQIYAHGWGISASVLLGIAKNAKRYRYECECVFMHVIFECITVVLLVNFISWFPSALCIQIITSLVALPQRECPPQVIEIWPPVGARCRRIRPARQKLQAGDCDLKQTAKLELQKKYYLFVIMIRLFGTWNYMPVFRH